MRLPVARLWLLALCAAFAGIARAAREHIKCGVYGFRSTKSKELLYGALQSGKPTGEDGSGGVTVLDLESSDDNVGLALHSLSSDDSAGVPSDLSIVFATLASVRLNEAAVLLDLHRAFTAVLAAEEKRPVVLILDTSAATSEEAEKAKQKLGDLAAEAWASLLEKAPYRSDMVANELDLRIVSVSELAKAPRLLADIVGTMAKDISGENVASRSLESLFPTLRTLGDSLSPTQQQQQQQQQVRAGMEDCMDAVQGALLRAQEAVQAAASKLEATSTFTVYVENLLDASKKRFHELLAGKDVDSGLVRRSEEEIRRKLFSALLPYYRRQVQLARSEVTKSFNTAVGEDLAITIHLMDDLDSERRNAINLFRQMCAALRPSGPNPSTWTSAFDEQQLLDSLNEYVAGREAQARTLGVLPRGRQPIDVSFHYLATHPFGRDYRQDALTVVPGRDRVLYDEDLAAEGEVSVSALKARALLKQKATTESHSLFESRRIDRDAEFAREMLMLPLSIKNPAVPLMAGRSKKRSSVAAAKVDPNRITLGPERFVRWDMSPLSEAKATLDAAISGRSFDGDEDEDDEDEDEGDEDEGVSSSAFPPGSGFMRRLMKKIPGIYQHPPINYGSKMGPSSARKGQR